MNSNLGYRSRSKQGFSPKKLKIIELKGTKICIYEGNFFERQHIAMLRRKINKILYFSSILRKLFLKVLYCLQVV